MRTRRFKPILVQRFSVQKSANAECDSSGAASFSNSHHSACAEVPSQRRKQNLPTDHWIESFTDWLQLPGFLRVNQDLAFSRVSTIKATSKVPIAKSTSRRKRIRLAIVASMAAIKRPMT